MRYFSYLMGSSLFLLGVLVLSLMEFPWFSSATEDYRFSQAPFQGGRFANPHLPLENRFAGFLRWRLGLGPKEPPALSPVLRIPFDPKVTKPDLNCLNHADPGTIQLTWLGHSTFLIQVAGLNLLTDPIFSERASPVTFLGPKRLVPPPLALAELPPIHGVLISHNHYDHLDYPTVKALGPGTAFFVPLGLRRWFLEAGLPWVREADWWQELPFGPLTLTAVPAQHFSLRRPGDANTTLWCGWILETPAGRIFFAGDTGYSPTFQEIGRRFGPIRLALIPIGGYQPRWFMRPVHLDPPEAVQVHLDIQARQSVGMHWGTFRLTEEDPAEPPVYLQQALAAAGLPAASFTTLNFGETRIFYPEAP